MLSNPTTTLIIRGARIGTAPSYQARPYVYGGDIPLSSDPDILGSSTGRPVRAKRTSVPLPPGAKCGTPYGYKLHSKAGTEKCQPCKDADATAREARRIAARAGLSKAGRFSDDACGTRRGHERHAYYGLEPCDPCKAANNKYSRNAKRKQRAK